MKKIYILLSFAFFTTVLGLKAQNSVGIGTTTPDINAVLDLQSPGNNQGLLVPRLTTAQRLAMTLAAAQNGLMVYDIGDNSFWYWDGGTATWVQMSGGADADWVIKADTVYNDFSWVAIGTSSPLNYARLTVANNGSRSGIAAYSDGDGSNAIAIEGYSEGAPDVNMGIYGGAYSSGTDTTIGVFGEADNIQIIGVGVRGEAFSGASNAIVIGGSFEANDENGNSFIMGVEGIAGSNSGIADTAIGIYGDAYGANENFAGFFENGKVYVQNNLGLKTLSPKTSLQISDYIHIDTVIGNYLLFSNNLTYNGSDFIRSVNGTGQMMYMGQEEFGIELYSNGTAGSGTGFKDTSNFSINWDRASISIKNPSSFDHAFSIYSGNGLGLLISAYDSLGTPRPSVLTFDNGNGWAANIKAPAVMFNGYTLSLPPDLPTVSGQVLSSDLSGNLSWTSASSGLPAGVQYQTMFHDGTNWMANSFLKVDSPNGVSISKNLGIAPSSNYDLYVYRDFGDFGANKYGIYSYRQGNNGVITGGTNWSPGGADAAIGGNVNWGNEYSAAVYGASILDYDNSASVLGANSGGVIYGALAYKYTGQVYAGFFQGNMYLGGAFMPNNLAGNSGEVLTSQGAGVAPIWQALPTPSNDWTLLGNAGTINGTHFIGTTDLVPLSFRVNNTESGLISNSGETFFGYRAGSSAVAGNNSVGIGFSALQNNTSGENTAVGYYALRFNTTGTNNVAVGLNALLNNTSSANTAIGYNSLSANTTSSENTAVGSNSLALSTGNRNTAIGTNALYNNTTGTHNTAVGYTTGGSFGTNTNCTFIGYQSAANSGGLTNATAIGALAQVSASNSLILGNGANVGIGTSAPLDKLHVVGNVYYTGAISLSGNTGLNGYVLTSTGGGANVWTDPSTFADGNGIYSGNGNVPSSTSVSLTDNINFDAGTFFIDGTLNNIGIGTTTPASSLHVNGNRIQVGVGSAGGAELQLATLALSNQSLNSIGTKGYRMWGYGDTYGTATLQNDLRLTFVNGTVHTPIFNIDISGKVGIGMSSLTESPVNTLDVEGGVAIGSTYSGGSIAPTNGLLVEGDIGVGLTSPTNHISVYNTGAHYIQVIDDMTGTASGDGIRLGVNGAGYGYMVWGELTEFSIGTSTDNNLIRINGTNNNVAIGIGSGSPSASNKFEVEIPSTDLDTETGIRIDNYSGSASTKYGLYNYTSGDGTGSRYGIYNYVASSGTFANTLYGQYSNVSSSGGATGTVYGYYMNLGGTSSGTEYGWFVTGEEFNYLSGGLRIGNNVSTEKFVAEHSVSGLYVGRFNNLANSTTAHGVIVRAGSNTTAGSYIMRYYRSDGSGIGGVYQNSATSVAYNTTSDIRLKNIKGISNYGLNDLMKIKIYDYTYKDDAENKNFTGFVAQELYDVFPQSVTKPVNLDDPKEDPWMVDYSSITPLIIKATQEQQTQIETLKKENEQLKNELDAIKKHIGME